MRFWRSMRARCCRRWVPWRWARRRPPCASRRCSACWRRWRCHGPRCTRTALRSCGRWWLPRTTVSARCARRPCAAAVHGRLLEGLQTYVSLGDASRVAAPECWLPVPCCSSRKVHEELLHSLCLWSPCRCGRRECVAAASWPLAGCRRAQGSSGSCYLGRAGACAMLPACGCVGLCAFRVTP